MGLMNWSEDFATGIAAVDEQHHNLVDLINQATPVLAHGYQRDPAASGQLLDALTSATVNHFKTEETLMVERGVDERHWRHHVAAHRQFMTDFANLRHRYETEPQLSGSELLGFLANWQVFHNLGEDRALGQQLRAIDAGTPPADAYELAANDHQHVASDALSRALGDLYALVTEQNRHLLEMNRELSQHREHLEDIVAERTRDLAAARDAAEAANRGKSSFIANLSHEIRTPMNAIVGLTWMLFEQSQDPEQKGKLQQVINATQQLLGIINDLLDLSRIESEQLELEPVDFSVSQLVDRLIADHTGKAQQKGLTLETDLPETLPPLLRGDAEQIARIIGNYLSNAIKFTSRGGILVTVRTRPLDGQMIELHLAVRDSGIGIPAAQCERLFQPFEQVEQSTRRRFGGTGLGLAICRKLAGLMGGTVGVDSTIDVGSTFWLKLPLPAVTIERTREPSNTPQNTDQVQPEQALPGVRELLEQLASLLAEDDIRSLNLWREWAERLRPTLGARAPHLEGELFAYNFENALRILDAALAETGPRS